MAWPCVGILDRGIQLCLLRLVPALSKPPKLELARLGGGKTFPPTRLARWKGKELVCDESRWLKLKDGRISLGHLEKTINA